MFDAVLKETGEPYHASEAFEEFDDPHSKDWICCPDEENQVTPRKAHSRHIGGKEVWVVEHFVRLPDEPLCKYGESETHKRLKTAAASLVSNEELLLSLEGHEIPQTELLFEEVEAPYRWIEKPVDERRPDVRVPFSEFHPILGKGIVFEVEMSPRSWDERRERERYMLDRKWSIIWIEEDDIDTENFALKPDVLEVSIPYYEGIVKSRVKDELEDLRQEVREEVLPTLTDDWREMGRERVDNIANNLASEVVEESGVRQLLSNPEEWIKGEISKTCRTCKHGSWDKNKAGKRTGMVACWYHYNKFSAKRPEKREPFDSCEHFRRKGGSRK